MKNQHVGKLSRYSVKWVSVEDIKPSPENDEIYGKIDADSDPQMPALVASIQRLGLEEPIICTADHFILSGHRRFHAVTLLGWPKVPVRFSPIRRVDTTDYHRLLAEYNPQRVKTVASLLAERFLNTETFVSAAIFAEREREKRRVAADFIDVDGSKLIEPIGERQLEFLAAAVAVVDELREFWPVTIRQIHYRLLNDPPLTQATKDRSERWRYRNNPKCYNALSSLLIPARYLGHIPMTAIDDQTRSSAAYAFATYGSIAEFVEKESENFLTGYQRHRQEGQPHHIEILIEKNTLLNIVQPVADEYHLPLSVARGYGNPSLWRKMETRWCDSSGERLILLAVSDHDPEGFDLIDDAARSLRDLHRVDVEVVRVGVTMEQIEEQQAPPAFAKESSSRFNQYVKRTGSQKCWEVEALDPRFLQSELRKAVCSVMNIEQFNAVVERQNVEGQQIDALRKRLGAGMMELLRREGI